MATTIPLAAYSKLPASDATSARSTISRLPSIASDEIPLVKIDFTDGKPSTNRRFFTCFHLVAWWLPEIVASIFSAACFAAIVGVLRRFDGRGLAEVNLPAHLTLNGLIAALATLNRAFLVAPVGSALMQELWLFYAAEAHKKAPLSRLIDLKAYDEASRNAWGAIKFLFRLRKPRVLAYLAALVMTMSIAFGTFLQQVVGFDGLVPVASNSDLLPGNLPRSESWTAFHGTSSANLNASYPPYDLVAAIYSGALGGGIPPIAANCPSGNCTWPLTPSLGVCGSCVNTTFIQECYDACPSTPSASGDCEKLPDAMCNYTLASGSHASLFNFSYTEPELWPGFQVISGSGAHFNRSTTDRMYLANFDMIGTPYLSNPKSWWEDVHVEAWECALWMCIQTHETTVTSTKQQDNVISIVDQQTSPYTLPRVNAEDDPRNVTNFTVSEFAVKTLMNYFDESFNGVAYVNRGAARLSSDLIAGIWNGTTAPQAWIDNVATSMSNIIRSTDTSIRLEYNGNAYQLGVNVRWEWMSLPAILVASSMLLLAIVMVRTAYSPVGAWKGSPLTLLLLNVDGRIKGASSEMIDEPRGLQAAVGSTRVRLMRQPDRLWSLKAA